jgi:RNA polymerase sigma factor (sigma-70 family)
MQNSRRFADPAVDTIFTRLSTWSRAYFRRLRWTDEESKDCTQEFVIAMWSHHDRAVYECWCGLRPIAWLICCADNFARNYLQRRLRQIGRETPLPTQEDARGSSMEYELLDTKPLPEIRLIRKEAQSLLFQALEHLRTEECELLLRHYIGRETFVLLAEESGRTPDAVRMTVTRARKKTLALLRSREFDTNGYLAILAPSPSSLFQRRILTNNSEAE